MTGSLRFYSKDEADNFNNAIAADNDNFKSFKYETNLIWSIAVTYRILEDTTIVVPLKHVIRF